VIEIYDTAGGPTRVYKIQRVVEVSMLTKDYESKKVITDIVISHIEVEALISDKLAEKLMLVIERPGERLWKFRYEKEKERVKNPYTGFKNINNIEECLMLCCIILMWF